MELLGPGCVKGFSAVGGLQEEGSEEVDCVLAPGFRQGGGSTSVTTAVFYGSGHVQVRGSWQRDERSAW